MDKKALPARIDADRIYLAKHELGLAERMFQYVDQDRERLRRFLPWVDLTLKLEDEIAFIRMSHEQWEAGQLFDYGIYRKSDGLYLGNVGVHTISWQHQRCELGYWILGQFEGQGFMTEAVLALERELFAAGFHRIEIRCSSANERSASVPRRAGYVLEAVLKEDAIEHGKFRDTLIFRKLKT